MINIGRETQVEVSSFGRKFGQKVDVKFRSKYRKGRRYEKVELMRTPKIIFGEISVDNQNFG